MQTEQPTTENTCILRAPRPKNYSTGNLSIPMDDMMNPNIKFFYYHGPIPGENIVVTIVMPKNIVRDGCIYRNPFKGNFYNTSQCKNNKTQFILLPFWQITQYIKTGQMTKMQGPEKNERITAEKTRKRTASTAAPAKPVQPAPVQGALFP